MVPPEKKIPRVVSSRRRQAENAARRAGTAQGGETDSDAPGIAPRPTVARRRVSRRRRQANLAIFDIMGNAISLYFRNFLLFFTVAIIVFSPIFILGFVLEGTGNPLLFRGLSLLLQQVVTAAIIYGVFRKLKNQPAPLDRCLATGIGRMFPVLGVVLISTMAMALATVLPFILAFGTAYVIPGLSILFLIVAGVVMAMVYCSFYVAVPAVVAERIGVTGAIKRSLVLTKGNRLLIFALVLLVLLVQFVVGAIVGVLLSFGLDVNFESGALTVFLAQQFVNVIFGAFSATVMALVFYNLKIQVEGVDAKELASVFD